MVKPADIDKEAIAEGFTAYERRLYAEVDRILYQNHLAPRTITDFWEGDRDGVVSGLKQLKERAIRLIVLTFYVEMDDVLSRLIYKYLVPKGSRQAKARTVRAMLDRLYLVQKLDIVTEFREITKETRKSLLALNQLRNTMAHRFGAGPIPKKERMYKNKHDVLTTKGLDKFRDDMIRVDEEIDGEILALATDLVREQTKNNRARKRRLDRG